MKSVLLVVKGVTTALLLASALALTASAADLLSVPDASFSPPLSGGGDSFVTSISPDGRYILFSSTANNLAKRTNGVPYLLPRPSALNVFLRDRTLGITMLVSADPADVAEGNYDSVPVTISTNGQYALFESGASNLVAGGSNAISDTELFVRNVSSKVTTLVTVATNGASAKGAPSGSTMSPDGRYVVFSSSATDLVANDTNGIADVFVRDLQLGVTTLASVGAVGTNLSAASVSPAITPDGRYVCFMSTATNLVPGLATRGELYLRDLSNHTTVCVSSNARPFVYPNELFRHDIACYNNKISYDGQIVVFQGSATNTASGPTNGFIFRHHVQTGVDDLVASNGIVPAVYERASTLDMTPDGRFIAFIGSTNSGTGVFVWDAQTATTVLASVDTNGTAPAKVDCDFPAITPDGRFVVFISNATNLTADSVGAGYHFYRRDLQAGVTRLIDAGTNGIAPARNLVVGGCAMSADGRFVAFDCFDADLVTNDNNRSSDVFLRDLNTETTELISLRQLGLPSRTGFRNGRSDSVTASADGRYFAFSCQGEALASNYTNTYNDVFVRDLVAQTNFVVSLDTNGVADANGDSFQPALSADGGYVAFSSYATNLVGNDTNNGSAVFVRDLTSGVTTLASVNSNGIALSGNSSHPSISSDGKYVLFQNGGSAILRDNVLGTNYVLATNGTTAAAMTPDGHYVTFYGGAPTALYVWDSQLRSLVYTNAATSISRLCISSNGQWLAYISSATISLADRIAGSVTNISAVTFVGDAGVRFSADGRWLVYATGTSKSPDDTNGVSDVYLYDDQAGTNSLISRSFYTGKAANGASDSPDISADGRYVVYASLATDIAPVDGNGREDIFLYDRQAGSTTLLSVNSQLQDSGNFISLRPAFVGDGQTVVFHTWASDLAENDFNRGDDLFVMRIASTNSPDSTNPPPAFTGEIIFVPNGTNSSPRLSWTVAAGKTYQVQFKDDLADPNWQPVTGTMAIEGSKASILDLAPNPDHRFYRIVGF